MKNISLLQHKNSPTIRVVCTSTMNAVGKCCQKQITTLPEIFHANAPFMQNHHQNNFFLNAFSLCTECYGNTFYTEKCLLFVFKNIFCNTDLFNENILVNTNSLRYIVKYFYAAALFSGTVHIYCTDFFSIKTH